MRRLRAWWIRLTGLVTAGRRAWQFDAELESHIELHVEENLRRGMTPDEARRQALIALGGVQATREAYRDRGGFPVLDTLAQDVRFAIRMLRKAPGFTAASILILSIGIGANAAVFSLINALLIRPLNAGMLDTELMGVYSGERTRPDRYRMFSYPEYLDIRDRNSVFAGLLAETGWRAGITEGGRTRRISAMLVSSNYFPVLGVTMAAGRGFTVSEEDPRSAAGVAVVSYTYWRQRGFPPDIVGGRITINGSEITIVGVAPEHFHGTMPVMSTDLWLPFGASSVVNRDRNLDPESAISPDRSSHTLLLVGTLKPGVTPEQAEARLAPLGDALAAAYPHTSKDQRLIVQARSRTGRGPQPRRDASAAVGATVLMAIAGLVLFIACINLANMLLARGDARRQEIAVRLALGGSRARIVRQLVVEGLLLSLVGGATALALSWWTAEQFVQGLRGILQTSTIALDVSPDARVVAVVIGVSLASTVVFSLGPAWRLSKPELATALKPSAPVAQTRSGRVPLPSLLVGAQIALSLTLLVAAAVFMRSSVRAASSDPGFALGGGVITELDAGLIGLDQTDARTVYGSVVARIRELPGVSAASLASIVPFGSRSEGRLVRGEAGQDDEMPMFATLTVVGARYFATLGLPVIAGRDFTEAEERDPMAPVAIVDQQFAERQFGTADPIGRIVYSTNWDNTSAEPLEIVGVVPTVRDDIMEAPNRPHLYVPFGRHYRSQMTLHARVAPGTEARMLAGLREAVRQVDERLPILSMRTLTEHRDASGSLWAVGLATRLFTAFGAVALVLATVGVYGLRAYLVARRTREIGIRIALGATHRGIIGQLLRESVRIAVAGLVSGLLLAAGLVQLLRQSGMLFEVGPIDPLAFTAAPLILAAVTMLASYVPARRALSIDTAVALRPE